MPCRKCKACRLAHQSESESDIGVVLRLTCQKPVPQNAMKWITEAKELKVPSSGVAINSAGTPPSRSGSCPVQTAARTPPMTSPAVRPHTGTSPTMSPTTSNTLQSGAAPASGSQIDGPSTSESRRLDSPVGVDAAGVEGNGGSATTTQSDFVSDATTLLASLSTADDIAGGSTSTGSPPTEPVDGEAAVVMVRCVKALPAGARPVAKSEQKGAKHWVLNLDGKK